MKKIITLFGFLFICYFSISQDTFSIIAVDSITGEIGAAGATCVDGIAQWGGIQLLNKIIPGKGGVNAQAWICLNPHVNLEMAMSQMQGGLSPEEIIQWLIENDNCSSQNFNPQYRQYGIVDIDETGSPRVAAFTGSQADDYKGHLTGPNYSIQGNILLGAEVLEQMEAGFINTEGSLEQKLMAAMQGANIPGADSRCLNRGTSSTSAFLRVVKPGDPFNEPWLELSILEMPFGQEPIDSLQILFDTWLSTSAYAVNHKNKPVKVYPNPAIDNVVFELENENNINAVKLLLYTLKGKEILKHTFNDSRFVLNRSSLPTGNIFIYKLTDGKNKEMQNGKVIFID